jgi:hypothetical protein
MRRRIATVLRIAIQVVVALAPGGLLVVGLYQLHRHRKRRAAKSREEVSP